MRASFITESMASEPDEVKNTRALGVGPICRNSSANVSAGSLVNGSNVEYAPSVRTWAAMASAISARPWPIALYHRLAMPSTSWRPFSSHTRAPSPRSMRMKLSRVGLE